MNTHYIQIILAFLLAQTLMASVLVYLYQKEKDIKYRQALYQYMCAEQGYFIIGFLGIVAVCFLLSEWVDLSLSKEELRNMKERTRVQNLQLYFKTSSFVVSSFIQVIVFKYRSKGKVAIDKFADKIQPD